MFLMLLRHIKAIRDAPAIFGMSVSNNGMETVLNSRSPPNWMRRFDRIAGDLNVLLVVFAIGLAALNLTFLLSQMVIGQLPTAGRVLNQIAASPT
jgi:hypothetical protein